MTPLSEPERAAVLEALDDEHLAWATYDQVLHDFGPVRPFLNIRAAEARHTGALEALCRRYAVPIPNNPWIGRVPRYDSIHDACLAGITAEIENAALYERLNAVTQHPDVLRVFHNLCSASQQRHLPAFRRCASRGRDCGGNGPRTARG